MIDQLYVVIPTCGRAKLLQQTLSSLAQCQKPSAYRKTIVVENGPNPRVQSLVESFRESLNTFYLYEPRKGLSRALNRAVSIISNALIIFTNDDVSFSSDYILAYSEAASNKESNVFYGGPIDINYEKAPPRWLLKQLPSSSKRRDHESVNIYEGPYFSGLNWAAHSEEIKKLGGFNLALGLGGSLGAVGEETEIQRKMLEAGFGSVFIKNAKLKHFVSKEACSPYWIVKRWYQYGKYHGFIRKGQRIDFFMKQSKKAKQRLWIYIRSLDISDSFRWVAYLFYGIGYLFGSMKR